MLKDLKNEWFTLASKYSSDLEMINTLWNELEKQYTSKSRFYHNFSHINYMLSQVEDFKGELSRVDDFKFSIWYHDVIYKSSKNDNEFKSAILSEKRLDSLGVHQDAIANISKLIISTKKHELILYDDIDNAYLLDIDLSVLGSSWECYKNYFSQIRKEYKIYPNFYIIQDERKC